MNHAFNLTAIVHLFWRRSALKGFSPIRHLCNRFPTRFLKSAWLVVFSSSLAWSQSPKSPSNGHEPIEWCDIWISHASDTNLPRVLLIGDSITRDYYPEVENRLMGKAYVARMATSRFLGDPVLLQEMALVLGNTKFQVIHFNIGMHGWQHSEAEYREAFPKFLATIRQYAPQAKLIWATTTPLSTSGEADSVTGSNQRIAARNAIAQTFTTTSKITVDDLNTLMREHPEYHRDNVHFNQAGIRMQSDRLRTQSAKAYCNDLMRRLKIGNPGGV